MTLVRVLEIAPSSGKFHFGGGEICPFVEVDWFRNDPPDVWDFSLPEVQAQLVDFIKAKNYFSPGKAYLILNEKHSFTIGYSAP